MQAFLHIVVFLLVMVILGVSVVALIILFLDAIGAIPRAFLSTLLGSHEDSFW